MRQSTTINNKSLFISVYTNSSASRLRSINRWGFVIVQLLVLTLVLNWFPTISTSSNSLTTQTSNQAPSSGGVTSSFTVPNSTSGTSTLTSKGSLAIQAKIPGEFNKQPLSFEINQGQVDNRVKFFSHGSGYTFFLTETEAVFSLSKPQPTLDQAKDKGFGPINPLKYDPLKIIKAAKQETEQSTTPEVVRMSLVGANPNPQVIGEEEQPGKSNYFIGNDPSKWQTNVTHYSRVRYKDVYPGIDVIYYGNEQGQLEYDFDLAPGSDPDIIRLTFNGVDRLEINDQSDLLLHLSRSELVQKAPQTYQKINGFKKNITGNYKLSTTDPNQVFFRLQNFDKTLPMTIDPSLSYSTHFGGSNDDSGFGIAVDRNGNTFVTGYTTSTDFPTQNAYQSNFSGGYNDTFITELNANGALVYSTYLGGSAADLGKGIAVDVNGNAFVTGNTASSNFPIKNAFQPNFGGGSFDAFVTKIEANGTLAYSTYLGGNESDMANAIALDGASNAYVTGSTGSSNFPVQNAFQPTLGEINSNDAFVTKLNTNGTLGYSTFLGGTSDDFGSGIAVDSGNNFYVTGYTYGSDFPIKSAYQTNISGSFDAFVTKLKADGTLAYSTFLGGSNGDIGYGIGVDRSGNAYVSGDTGSDDFPAQNAFQPNYGGGGDAFVVKLNVNGSLIYSTYLGGSGSDKGLSIAVDGNGNAHITGVTASPNFTLKNPFQPNLIGLGDGYVTKLNPNGTLAYSSYLDNSENDYGQGIAVDGIGNAYVTGIANEYEDVYVGKISPFNPPPAPGPTSNQAAGGGSTSQRAYQVTQTCTCDPINNAYGTFFHTFDDLNISGRGFPLAFSHTYNSQFNTVNGSLGYGWTFNYNMSLSQDQTSGAVTISEEGGSQLTFTISNGTYEPPDFTQAILVKNGDGTFTFTRLNRQVFTFSATGHLIQEKDLNGYATSFTYNGSGQLTTVTDSPGRTLTLAYSGAHLTSVTDPVNRHVLFSYDGNGNLSSYTDVGGGITNFTYDANHLLLTMQDPRGGTTTNHYDSQNRVDWQSDQLGRKTTLAYSADGTTITDPKGNVTFEQYINNVRVASTKGYGTPQAATTTFTYDPLSMGIATVTDPNGNVTSYTYDDQGNVLTVKDALNRTTTNTYNAFNELLTTTDPKGVTTTFTYDNKGNLLTQSRPLNSNTNQVTTYHYDDGSHPGDVTSMTDPNGENWTYTYDSYGNLASSSNSLAQKTIFTSNNLGWKTAQTTPKGEALANLPAYTTTFGYDSFGLPTTTTDPLGHTTIRHYDPDHNLDRFTDAKGNITKYTSDAANEQTLITRPDNTTLKTDYFPDGSVAKQYDGKNQATVYTYDPLGRLITQTDPLGRSTNFTYDGVGNRLSMTAAQGQVTTYNYDAANELKGVSYSDGVTSNVTNITYDPDGFRTAMTDGTGTSSWSYDQLNRLISSTNGAGQVVGYCYDLKGQLIGLIYPGNKSITRNYDSAGRLNSITDWLGNTTSFGYDFNSNLTTQTLPTASGVNDTYSYDQVDRLVGITYKKAGTNFASFTYTRDETNLITSDTPTGVVQPAKTYNYNSLNQLQGANGENFSYDQADNINGRSGITFSYDAASQLTSLTKAGQSTAFTYDTRGNRKAVTPAGVTATTYNYDQANRLTAFETQATYRYNGYGLRMSKTVNGTTTPFVWDEGEGLPLLLKEGNTSYVYGPGGLPLEQITQNGTVYYYHHDQLGSTRLITDATGNVVATYTYDEWGNPRVKTGKITFQSNGHFKAEGGGVNQPFGYAGQYTDGESGLIYLRARFYDPSTSQFITKDPAENLTNQPYVYSTQDPVNFLDKSGLSEEPGVLGIRWGDVGEDAGTIFSGGLEGAVSLHEVFVGGITADSVYSFSKGSYKDFIGSWNLVIDLSRQSVKFREEETDLGRQLVKSTGANENVVNAVGILEDSYDLLKPIPYSSNPWKRGFSALSKEFTGYTLLKDIFATQTCTNLDPNYQDIVTFQS